MTSQKEGSGIEELKILFIYTQRTTVNIGYNELYGSTSNICSLYPLFVITVKLYVLHRTFGTQNFTNLVRYTCDFVITEFDCNFKIDNNKLKDLKLFDVVIE